MVVENKELTFGSLLRTARVKKEISFDEIFDKTRIGKIVIENIENEDHDALPAEVFVKGFLRAYSKALGVDDDEVIELYLRSIGKSEKNDDPKPKTKKKEPTPWPIFAAAIAIFILIVAGAALLMKETDTQAVPEVPVQQEIQEETAQLEEIVQPDPEPAPVPEPEAVEALPQRHSLKVVTLEDTWMKVIIDGQKPKEYMLVPGDEMELEADTEFSLLIGNAGGVNLLLNDNSVEVPGKSGQVVTLQLP